MIDVAGVALVVSSRVCQGVFGVIKVGRGKNTAIISPLAVAVCVSNHRAVSQLLGYRMCWWLKEELVRFNLHDFFPISLILARGSFNPCIRIILDCNHAMRFVPIQVPCTSTTSLTSIVNYTVKGFLFWYARWSFKTICDGVHPFWDRGGSEGPAGAAWVLIFDSRHFASPVNLFKILGW